MENYHSSIELNATPEKVFNALTNRIPLWWTEMFEGSSNQAGDTFTVRFGNNVFKSIRVEELTAHTRVSWHVTDSVIAVPELQNQKEWIGARIIWEIFPKNIHAQLQLLHIGLNPEIECYQMCSKGWQQFTDSLKLYVETGI